MYTRSSQHLKGHITIKGSSLNESLLAGGEGSALLEGSLSVLAGSSSLLSRASLSSGGERVEASHDIGVLEGVALGGDGLGNGNSGLDNGLDLVRVNQTGQVSVGHVSMGEVEAALGSGVLLEGSEELIKLVEGTLSPDDESAQMSTGGKVEQVQVLHRGDLNTGQVLESSHKALVIGVHHKRPSAHDIASVSHLSGASTDLSGVLGLLHIGISTEGSKDSKRILGLGDGVDRVRKDQGELRDGLHSVATGHNKGHNGGSSESRGHGVSALVHVDLSVPASPDLGRGKHATTTAHVSESTLSGSGGTAARDTGDTGNSTSSSPRLGRGLHTSLLRDGVGLAGVLGHEVVDVVHNIGTDGGGQHGRQSSLGNDGARVGRIKDRDKRTRHFPY